VALVWKGCGSYLFTGIQGTVVVRILSRRADLFRQKVPFFDQVYPNMPVKHFPQVQSNMFGESFFVRAKS